MQLGFPLLHSPRIDIPVTLVGLTRMAVIVSFYTAVLSSAGGRKIEKTNYSLWRPQVVHGPPFRLLDYWGKRNDTLSSEVLNVVVQGKHELAG